MGELLIKELVKRLESAIAVIQKDLATVRTGRAKTSLVEDVTVEAYGSLMKIKELTSISVPDPSLIVISPWDKSVITAISTGIQKAELNITPVVDKEMIKLAIPPLTEERRKEMVKSVHQKLESGRIMIRNIRGEIKDEIEKLEGESGVSEDDIKGWLSAMQKEVDKFMAVVDGLGEQKEKELMTI